MEPWLAKGRTSFELAASPGGGKLLAHSGFNFSRSAAYLRQRRTRCLSVSVLWYAPLLHLHESTRSYVSTAGCLVWGLHKCRGAYPTRSLSVSQSVSPTIEGIPQFSSDSYLLCLALHSEIQWQRASAKLQHSKGGKEEQFRMNRGEKNDTTPQQQRKYVSMMQCDLLTGRSRSRVSAHRASQAGSSPDSGWLPRYCNVL